MCPFTLQYTGALTEETPKRYGGHHGKHLLEEDDDFSGGLLDSSDSGSDDAFYTTEEGQVAENPDSIFSGSSETFRRKEDQYRRAMGERKRPRLSARQSALQFDQEKWERDRMQASGVLVQEGEVVDVVWDCESSKRTWRRSGRH